MNMNIKLSLKYPARFCSATLTIAFVTMAFLSSPTFADTHHRPDVSSHPESLTFSVGQNIHYQNLTRENIEHIAEHIHELFHVIPSTASRSELDQLRAESDDVMLLVHDAPEMKKKQVLTLKGAKSPTLLSDLVLLASTSDEEHQVNEDFHNFFQAVLDLAHGTLRKDIIAGITAEKTDKNAAKTTKHIHENSTAQVEPHKEERRIPIAPSATSTYIEVHIGNKHHTHSISQEGADQILSDLLTIQAMVGYEAQDSTEGITHHHVGSELQLDVQPSNDVVFVIVTKTGRSSSNKDGNFDTAIVRILASEFQSGVEQVLYGPSTENLDAELTATVDSFFNIAVNMVTKDLDQNPTGKPRSRYDQQPTIKRFDDIESSAPNKLDSYRCLTLTMSELMEHGLNLVSSQLGHTPEDLEITSIHGDDAEICVK